MIMVLAPSKVVLRSRPEDWLDATAGEAVLLTGEDGLGDAELAAYEPAFQAIERFGAYARNDLVVVRAAELAAGDGVQAVLPLSEVDVLRAAALRERAGIPGLDRAQSTLFRDKIAMKDRLREHGIPTAEYRRVTDALMLEDFIAEHGLPVVLKPIAGRGSALTSILRTRDDVDGVLRGGAITGTDRVPDMLVEAYVDGDLHHIDGMYVDDECRFISSARYIGSHVGYRGGGYLGSIVLDQQGVRARELVEMTRHVLEDVLGIGRDGLFHVEIFVDRAGRLVFNEAAIRMAGSPINEEIEEAFGIDLKLSFVHAIAARHNGHAGPDGPWPQRGSAGQLVISPRAGVLQAIPETCPFPWVVEYRHKAPGQRYGLMEYTNDEIASFVVAGRTEAVVDARLSEIRNWFEAETAWGR